MLQAELKDVNEKKYYTDFLTLFNKAVTCMIFNFIRSGSVCNLDTRFFEHPALVGT